MYFLYEQGHEQSLHDNSILGVVMEEVWNYLQYVPPLEQV